MWTIVIDIWYLFTQIGKQICVRSDKVFCAGTFDILFIFFSLSVYSEICLRRDLWRGKVRSNLV